MRYKYRNRSFWCRCYYVDTVGKNAIVIARYIDEQLKEDRSLEQLTLDKVDPFTGNRRQNLQMANCYSAFKQGQNKSLYRRQRKTTSFTSEFFFYLYKQSLIFIFLIH